MVITARAGLLGTGMTRVMPQHSERYYKLSGTRFGIINACRSMNRFAVFPETLERGARRLQRAEQMRANWLFAEGAPGALERLFPDLFSPINGCPF